METGKEEREKGQKQVWNGLAMCSTIWAGCRSGWVQCHHSLPNVAVKSFLTCLCVVCESCREQMPAPVGQCVSCGTEWRHPGLWWQQLGSVDLVVSHQWLWSWCPHKIKEEREPNVNYFKVVSCIIINFHSKNLTGKMRKPQSLYHIPNPYAELREMMKSNLLLSTSVCVAW